MNHCDCGSSFLSKSGLDEHKKKWHGEAKCVRCGVKFKKKVPWQTHHSKACGIYDRITTYRKKVKDNGRSRKV